MGADGAGPVGTGQSLPLCPGAAGGHRSAMTMQSAERDRLDGLYRARVAETAAGLPGYAKAWARLEAALVALGGELVVPPRTIEEDLAALLGRGRAFSGAAARLVSGRPSACHANAAGLWAEGVGEVCTGYALSDDGLWRQHSWVVSAGRTGSDEVVVETTEARLGYFGFVLSPDEAAEFAWQNP